MPEPGNIVGIYRIDGPDSYTVIADIGACNLANPPSGFGFFIPTGVQYSMDVFRHSFLVTDGHLNRVLWVTLDGEISEFMAFGNIVPTGLTVRGNTVYMAEAGPVPHAAEDGKIVTFGPKSTAATELASGAPLMVDVQFGRGRKTMTSTSSRFPAKSGSSRTFRSLRSAGDNAEGMSGTNSSG